jgi:diguanylate cyclase (GGDEF)-like protein
MATQIGRFLKKIELSNISLYKSICLITLLITIVFGFLNNILEIKDLLVLRIFVIISCILFFSLLFKKEKSKKYLKKIDIVSFHISISLTILSLYNLFSNLDKYYLHLEIIHLIIVLGSMLIFRKNWILSIYLILNFLILITYFFILKLNLEEILFWGLGYIAITLIFLLYIKSKKVIIENYSLLKEKLEGMIYKDYLTGILNRQGLIEEIEKSVAHAVREKEYVSIIMLDLNNFKEVNDTIGHEAGDALLIQVAYRLSKCFRTTDIVGRLGGDEFMVICNIKTNKEEITKLVNKIIEIFDKPYEGFEKYNISASIGVSIYPFNGLNTKTLMKNADIAMYDAKKNNKWFSIYEEKNLL